MTRTSRTGCAVPVSATLGAVLIGVAEFTTLFTIHSVLRRSPVATVSAGSHHAYAMIPLALLALALIHGVWLTGSRAALLALGVVGVIALLIALIGDLPDAQSTGLLRSPAAAGSPAGLTSATSRPALGLYLETLGGVLLLIAGGLGLLAPAAPSQTRSRSGRPAARGDRTEV